MDRLARFLSLTLNRCKTSETLWSYIIHAAPVTLPQSWPLDTPCFYLIRLEILLLKLFFDLPRIVGAIFGLILLVNVRSLPLVWHIKVFLPLGIMRCKYLALSLYHALLLRPPATRHKSVVARLESCCPVGADPFNFSVTTGSWASPDETDWFGHVSNSTYAKARDVALSKFITTAYPTFVNAGGFAFLGSTHYNFLQEIPRFEKYHMNLSIGTWDHKWLYLICRFTSALPDSREHSGGHAAGNRLVLQDTTNGRASSPSMDHAIHTCSTPSIPKEGPLKETLHCFSVSRLCFKMGRITVPPAIVMACEGFSGPPTKGSYSHQSPPPHWVHPHTLRTASDSLKAYWQFLAGGWKDVAEADRWWIDPLSGPIEERRRENWAKLEIVDRGLVDCLDI